jgi:hypothetical protein
LHYVELALEFSNSTNIALTKPDLKIDVGSFDPDGSENGYDSSSIRWEPQSGRIVIDFSDTPLPKFWESNGRLASAIDLENALLKVSFQSIMVPSLGDAESSRKVLESRKGLRLTFLVLKYSGRTVYVRGENMAETVNEKGLRTYTKRLESSDLGK